MAIDYTVSNSIYETLILYHDSTMVYVTFYSIVIECRYIYKKILLFSIPYNSIQNFDSK